MAVAALPPPPSSSSSAMPPMPVDLSMDPHSVPPELKNEGADWFAIFNPAPLGPGDAPGTKKRTLDVQLVHTLMHERYADQMRSISNAEVSRSRSVLCAACVSPRTASTWPQDAIALHRSTTPRLDRKRGASDFLKLSFLRGLFNRVGVGVQRIGG